MRVEVASPTRRVSAAVAGGLVAGAVVGGVGGRLAMLLLRATSSPALHGTETDDGFVIGQVSGNTLVLVALTVGLGILGGLAYLAIRSWIPARHRIWTMAVLGCVIGGAMFIHPNGVDFLLLEPLWLAIVMFMLLPATYGALVSVLVERWLDRRSRLQASRAWLLALVPLLVFPSTGLTGLLFLLGLVALWAIGWVAPGLGAVWSSRPVTWVGRACLIGVTGYALAELVDDIGQIL